MNARKYLLTCMLAAALTAGAAVAEPLVSDEDTIAFLGMNGSPGEPRKCLEIYVVNSVELVGLGSRFEFDSTVLAPVAVDTTGGGGVAVKHELLGRAVGYIGAVIARSDRPGILVVNFVPDFIGQARIPAGSGPIVRVYFDVLPTAALGGSLFTPADTEFIINNFATPEAELILPTLVGSDFNAVLLPYVAGDPDSSGFVDISDVFYLANYLFASGPAPSPRNSGDVNGDCTLNIADICDLVAYIIGSSEGPQIGCVECSY